MKTKEEIVEILKQELPYLKKKYGITDIGMAGSYARGEARPNSDIDIIVKIESRISLLDFIHVENYLTEKLGTKVDLVDIDNIKPRIKPYILEDAVYA
ncbi:MAG: nucleotidyltransferase family protein [Thermoplasmata archaeon]